MPKSKVKSRGSYFDYASSATLGSANPSALHSLGVAEKNKLETARKKIAKALGALPDEVYFTSGATEANNLAILGLVSSFKRPHVVTTNIEHASVLEVCRHLKDSGGAQVTFVPVEANGIVDPKKIKKALRPNTVLVSVMYANNEIGTIQPIREIAKEIRHFNKVHSKKIFFHTDAVQAMNYLPVGVNLLGVDLMAFNAAKIYGPQGVGALFIKRGTPVKKIMYGGDQEGGLRPGTENVLGVVALAEALALSEKIKTKESQRLVQLQKYFLEKIANLTDFQINGDLKHRLPNNINITIPKIPSDLLVIELSARGIYASAKSACKSGDGKVSHVLKAIDPTLSEEDGSLRLSIGRGTTKSDVTHLVRSLEDILKKLKKWYN